MGILNVINKSGFISYSTDKNSKDIWNRRGGGGGGGFGGGGGIWSSCEQIMWVSAGGLKYPVYLKPGMNNVEFWVPHIFPDITIIESPIVIETDGYILIPAGFEWIFITGEDAPPCPANQKMADKITFKDFYDIEIYSKPISIDLDNVVDKLNFGDVSHLELINVNINEISQLENVGYKDIYKLDLEMSVPKEDIEINNGEVNVTENEMIVDIVNTEIINIKITDNQSGVEAAGFSDLYDIEIIRG